VSVDRPPEGWADRLAELLRLVDRSDVEELEVEHEGARFFIRREVGAHPEATVQPSTQRPAPSARPETYAVTSPIVGIFRRAGDAQVEPGAALEAGQVVGAVEAMRVQSRVQTERAGVVQEVLVRDGQPVEYGQPLVVLRLP
jgi:acetyl-CoA carboxylase biotin carboxyl carrier protein